MADEIHDAFMRGLREGEVKSLGETVGKVELRLDSHEKRITAQERITYSLLGIIAFLNVWPSLQAAFGVI